MSTLTAAPAPGDDDAVRRQLEDLQRQVASLAAQLSRLTGPYPRLFLAKDGDSEGQWQEQTVYDGDIVEFTQGRVSDVDDHPSNLIDPDDAYFVQEFTDVDTDSGKLVTRFVKVKGESGFWAQIDSAAAVVGEDNQWDYGFTEKERTSTGWQTVTDGRTGTARNSIEANNDGADIEGNSIDHGGADYPAGFSLQAVRGQPIVWMRASKAADTGDTVYTFEYVNAEDGTCEAP